MKLSVLQEQRLQQLIQHLSQSEGTEALIAPVSPTNQEGDTESSENQHFTPTLVAIASVEQQSALLNEVGWIREVQHVAYHYRRSANSFRVLFSDGVICDFYCYTHQELAAFKPLNDCQWQLYWHAKNIEVTHYPHQDYHSIASTKDALIGELLTMLVLGLRIFSQGQKLIAFNLVQHRALSHLIKLKAILPATEHRALAPTWEAHAPEFDDYLPSFAAGFAHTPQSAIAMLHYVESLMPINYFIKDQILNLADACQTRA